LEGLGGEFVGVADAAEVEEGVGLGGDLAVAEAEDDGDVGAEVLGGEADGDVDEVVRPSGSAPFRCT
jgi:hypothetical protein